MWSGLAKRYKLFLPATILYKLQIEKASNINVLLAFGP